MSMTDENRDEFLGAIVEACRPLHKAIADHAVEAAENNKKQDIILGNVLKQTEAMQLAQTGYNTTLSNIGIIIENIDKKLDTQDKKMDAQLIRHGETSGIVGSLRKQNKEQFERLVVLESHAPVTPSSKEVEIKPLTSFLNNKIVQWGIVVVAIITVYGIFSYIGVDVSGAKALISPLASGE